MREQEPTTQTITISDVKDKLPLLIDGVAHNETRIIVERDGTAIVAIVSVEDLRELARLDAERAERRRIVTAMREPFRGVPPEEIERETAQAVAEVRDEMRHERETAAVSQ